MMTADSVEIVRPEYVLQSCSGRQRSGSTWVCRVRVSGGARSGARMRSLAPWMGRRCSTDVRMEEPGLQRDDLGFEVVLHDDLYIIGACRRGRRTGPDCQNRSEHAGAGYSVSHCISLQAKVQAKQRVDCMRTGCSGSRARSLARCASLALFYARRALSLRISLLTTTPTADAL